MEKGDNEKKRLSERREWNFVAIFAFHFLVPQGAP